MSVKTRLAQFRDKEFVEADAVTWLKLIEETAKQESTIIDSFLTQLSGDCESVTSSLQKGIAPPEYIIYTILRIRVLSNDVKQPVYVYGSDWYTDPNAAVINDFDTTWCLGYLYDLQTKLISMAEGISLLNSAHIELMVMELLPKYIQHMGMVYQKAAEQINNILNASFDKCPSVLLGEYQDQIIPLN